MVDAGASSAEIRQEVFEIFKAKMDSSGVDEEVQRVIDENLTSESPPERITDEVLAVLEDTDEA